MKSDNFNLKKATETIKNTTEQVLRNEELKKLKESLKFANLQHKLDTSNSGSDNGGSMRKSSGNKSSEKRRNNIHIEENLSLGS